MVCAHAEGIVGGDIFNLCKAPPFTSASENKPRFGITGGLRQNFDTHGESLCTFCHAKEAWWKAVHLRETEPLLFLPVVTRAAGGAELHTRGKSPPLQISWALMSLDFWHLVCILPEKEKGVEEKMLEGKEWRIVGVDTVKYILFKKNTMLKMVILSKLSYSYTHWY